MLPAAVSMDELRQVVAISASWRDVLRRLGLSSPARGRRLRNLCDEAEISYSHFYGMSGANDVRLAEAFCSASTWAEVLCQIGYSPGSGSARASLRRRAFLIGVDVSHLDNGGKGAASGPFVGPVNISNLRRAAAFIVAGRCALLGYEVSWPLEPTAYDLIVDMGAAGLARVQVKSGTRRVSGSWSVWITRRAEASGNGERRVSYTPEEIDYFGIVDGDQEVYMIPVLDVEGRTALSLSAYAAYRVSA